ncbi:hypothetical protein FDECE_4609 [Fusarium decemcellulare]|nr:hypothetical protein FDECE_4609 [Fusarium decemcellulare]
MLAQQLSVTDYSTAHSSNNDFLTPPSLDNWGRDQQTKDRNGDGSVSTTGNPPDNYNNDQSFPGTPLHSSREGGCEWWLAVPEQLLTDLIHLFFDKIQAWLPLLHRPRFFARYMKNGVFATTRTQPFSDIESLLLCGMFALAARHSSHPWLQDIPAPDRGQRFADEASKYYAMPRAPEQGPTLEYLQGCILLAIYEYSSGPSHRAWILAGVCVRLAYDLNLCNMDEQDNSVNSEDWSCLEEQRRAFWLVWEVDTFGSVMSRRPSSINRSLMAVRLPVGDADWFADSPVKSPVIDSRPSEAWKILLDSPNQSERAWYLVANILMTVASEFAAGRHTCRRDKDELVDAITCFSIVISQRFSLEDIEFSGPCSDAARQNWVIVSQYDDEGRRACHKTYLAYYTNGGRNRAYPSQETLQVPGMRYHNIETVNLVLSQYASVWKLASVLLDLRAFLIRCDHISAGALLEKRFALYFPHRASPGHQDGQSNLMTMAISGTARNDNEADAEIWSDPDVGQQQISQPSGELGNVDGWIDELSDIPDRELSKFLHLDSRNDWNSRQSFEYISGENQQLDYLQLLTNEFKNKARETLDGPPHELTERDIEIPVRDSSSILAYVYARSKESTDALPIFLFFHGGGFCIGSRHDDLESNRIIASKTSIIVVSLEYRLAPEHPFPQAIHDGFDALHWIANNPSQVHPAASPSSGLIVGGTSAGGSIANAVVYLNRDLGSPVTVTGQLLSVAPLLPPPVVPRKYQDDYISNKQNKDVAIPSEELTQLFLAAYKPDKTSPLAVPAIHPSGHAGIPPTYLQACGLDGLRDESLIYQRILEHENGIATRLDLYPGLPHHFWDFFPQLTKQVEKRTNDTVEGIRWLLEGARA